MSLKEEVFDIIREQDLLKLKYAELEKIKIEKLRLLAEEEKKEK
jgi:hypothetical protein